jgi:uncharacterized protein YjbJ (UPF0337 family)
MRHGRVPSLSMRSVLLLSRRGRTGLRRGLRRGRPPASLPTLLINRPTERIEEEHEHLLHHRRRGRGARPPRILRVPLASGTGPGGSGLVSTYRGRPGQCAAARRHPPGHLKEAAGVLTDDDRLRREGQRDQVVGKVKGTAERAVDTVKDALTGRQTAPPGQVMRVDQQITGRGGSIA